MVRRSIALGFYLCGMNLAKIYTGFVYDLKVKLLMGEQEKFVGVSD